MSMFNQVQRDEAWVLRMADAEEGVSLQVSGLQGRLNILRAEAAQRSLGQFVELSRRQMGLSSAQLAEQAQVNLTDLVAIETGNAVAGNGQTIVRLAAFLGVDAEPLLSLAGLSPTVDQQLDELAVQFAARLEPVAPLEPREQEALNWFKSAAFKPRPQTAKVG